jgi:hypothetical protein
MQPNPIFNLGCEYAWEESVYDCSLEFCVVSEMRTLCQSFPRVLFFPFSLRAEYFEQQIKIVGMVLNLSSLSLVSKGSCLLLEMYEL